MIPQCIDQGVGVIPWSPLARGILAGSRARDGAQRTTRSGSDPFIDSLYTSAADFDVVDRVGEVAGRRGVPAAQVALAWLLHRPGVTAPIVGATKLGHLEDALAAEELALSDEEMRQLEEPYLPHAVSGHVWGRGRGSWEGPGPPAVSPRSPRARAGARRGRRPRGAVSRPR